MFLTTLYPLWKTCQSMKHLKCDKIEKPTFNCYVASKELRPLPQIENLKELIFENYYHTNHDW